MTLFSNIILLKILNLINLDVEEAPVTRDDLSRYITPMWKGSSQVDSGDIVYFNYQGRTRYALVAGARNGNGIYVTPKNRRVMSCFLISDADPELVDSVVKGLYTTAKNKRLTVKQLLEYKTVIASFKTLFGSSNFRTFRLDRISGAINQVILRR